MGTFGVLNKKLVIVASAAVLIFGTTVFFEDAYAGINGGDPGVFWTGEGDGSSWNDPNNWRDFFSEEHRVPTCEDRIDIFSETAAVILNVPHEICPSGTLLVFGGASLTINPGQTLTNQVGEDTIRISCDSTLEVLGTLDNFGLITVFCSSAELLNNGVVINHDGAEIDIFDGTYTNNGPTINDGIIFIFGACCTLNNNDVINNNNFIRIFSGETLNNNQEGVINNAEGARILIHGTLNNDGELNNEGDIDSEGDLNNGLLGLINNDGTITNTSPSSIENDGDINNGVDGVINNSVGHIDNFLAALILNEGTINNGPATIDNTGTIINQCTGVINGPSPNDINPGITFNRSCNGPLYSISVNEGVSILEIDPTDATEVSSFDIGVAEAGYGLATNPLTGTLWGLVGEGIGVSQGILTIDPIAETNSALIATDRADLTDIAFDSSGTLLGVTETEAIESSTSTLVQIDTTDGTTTELCDFNDEFTVDAVPNSIGFNFDDGFLYRALRAVNEGTFQKITDTSGEECVTLDQATEGSGFGSNYQALTWGDDEEKFFAADASSGDTLFDMIVNGINSWEITEIGPFESLLFHVSHGLAFVPFEEPQPAPPIPVSTGGGGPHPNPTIGLDVNNNQVVPCGVMFDLTCFTITSKFHYEFELYEMMSGTHTISITTYCHQGVDKCNYVAIGIMPYSEDMNNATWKIELHKDHLGNLTPVLYDPDGFIVNYTVTAQIVGGKFWLVSFTIEFANKDTGPMQFAVEVRDSSNGVQITYLNEGVEIKDAHAYPYIETAFEEPLEVEPLCIGEDVLHRHSCAFDKVKEWATENAEETMRQILNNEYTYK